ncbi:MAG: hypothetical protein O3B87_00395 [bacterium]|nr:hypothetical protein [bacterium]
MKQSHSLTFTENELLYLLVISGAENDDIFTRFDLQIEDTTKERLDAGKESLVSRELITYKDSSDIPLIDDTVIGLVGAIAVGTKEGEWYTETQTKFKAKIIKEGEWYVIRGEEE